MKAIKKFLSSVADWIFTGKRLPILVVAVILVITGVTIGILAVSNKEDVELVSVYLTVEGLGEELDFEKRVLKIEDGATVKEIFSLAEYPEYYEAFGRPFVQYNEFQSFMGVKKGEKSFHVMVNDIHDSNLDQAYVAAGSTILIKYY